MAFLSKHIDQLRVENVISPGSSVSSSSEIAKFYRPVHAPESETESSENGTDDVADTLPDQPKVRIEVYPGSTLTICEWEDYN